MKTIIPNSIKTIEEAKAVLISMHGNGESICPDDSAETIVGNNGLPFFTEDEAIKVNELFATIACLFPDFDMYAFILTLDRLKDVYLFTDLSGRDCESEMTCEHIFNSWDLSNESYDGVSLSSYLAISDIGDVWESGANSLVKI